MAKQTVTRRQKDISRLLREKGRQQRDAQPHPSPRRAAGLRGRNAPKKQPSARALSFSQEDLEQMERTGISPKQVIGQINLLRNGAPPVDLNRPCRLGDGIETIPAGMEETLVRLHDEAAQSGRLMKFVPASGAASRMFRDWYQYLQETGTDEEAIERTLADHLAKYPFIIDLRSVMAGAGHDLQDLLKKKRFREVLSFILEAPGLGYGQLPKALIKFHAYGQESRTALEEHLVEAALHVHDSRKTCRLHFTVSEEHLSLITNYLADIQEDYEHRWGVTYRIEVSVQSSATQTIAVDLDHRPFRLEDGTLCFRPGGHGALLENLNAVDGDIIFIKNIDNITPDRLKGTTVRYKKMLGGHLVRRQRQIFAALKELRQKEAPSDSLENIKTFCQESLHIAMPSRFDEMEETQKRAFLLKKLNRPLRVCGIVKNEGEPGGGPFWINESEGNQSLQIVEESQIDNQSPAQRDIWRRSTHFNPVDIVCGIRDFRGKKFDLRRFVDPQAVVITKKTEKGRELKALELPGLWNGAMADWITVFVEVPIETFNPVKTVTDLLRPTHQ